jgi:hypothetical protein
MQMQDLFAMCSPGRWSARAAQFRRGRRPWSGGSGRGVVLGLPRLDFDRRLGRWWRRRSRAVAAAAASRGTPCSDEPPTGARERAVRSTPAGARGGTGTVTRPRELVGAWLGGDGANGVLRRRARTREGAAPLNRWQGGVARPRGLTVKDALGVKASYGGEPR